MKLIKTISLFSLALAFFSCGQEAKEIATSDQAIQVTIAMPEITNASSFSASGTVQAEQRATISTRMMGYVDAIPVKVGSTVKQGDILIRINNTDLLAQRAQAEASVSEATAALANVKKNHARFETLFASQSITTKEMDDMIMNLKMAESRLDAAQQMRNQINAQLSYSDIRAPFDGIITNKFINKGDIANPGVPLLGIENPNELHIAAMIPESSIGNIEQDMKTVVTIKSTGYQTTGKIVEISRSAQHTGGQFMVKVAFEQTEAELLPGMFASVHFPSTNSMATTAVTNTLTLPKKALIKRGQLSGVYIVSENNKALLRWLRLGKSFGDNVEVLSGLTANEPYILAAQGKLYNGVSVINE